MAITAYVKTCSAHTPGNRQLLLIPADEVTSVTMATGEVTLMVQSAANDAVAISFDRDGMTRMEENTATKGGILYSTQKLEIDLSGSSTNLQKLIKEIADTSVCGIVAIVVDANSERWLMGVEAIGTFGTATTTTIVGLQLESANFTSGKSMDEEDGDKYVLTLSGMFRHGAIHIKSTQVIDVGDTTLIDNPPA